MAGGVVSGPALALAERVRRAAPPSGTLVSRTVHDLVLGSGLTFTEQAGDGRPPAGLDPLYALAEDVTPH